MKGLRQEFTEIKANMRTVEGKLGNLNEDMKDMKTDVSLALDKANKVEKSMQELKSKSRL